jgi:hypothetical protein
MTTFHRLAAATLAVTAITLTACGKNEAFDDAPVGVIDDSPSKILTNADQFPNIAVRCYGVNGIYTTTRDYDAITIVTNDPECGGDPTKTAVSG